MKRLGSSQNGLELNIGVSRNRFCDFLADLDSRSFSRFGAIIMQFAVRSVATKRCGEEIRMQPPAQTEEPTVS